ncbi:MAG: DUF3048 domain-containing protein, partial [Acidimicrobiia bacterium]|nr:DUF3048 domain-containing protein [Acidimicrobiia bacterium]
MRAATNWARSGTARIVAALVVAGAAAAGCSGGGDAEVTSDSVPATTGTAPSTTAPTTTAPATTLPVVERERSPLNGLPLPPGMDTSRPAVAVKIDNHVDARPQAGLEAADLVFEEQVESLSRFAAVFWSVD